MFGVHREIYPIVNVKLHLDSSDAREIAICSVQGVTYFFKDILVLLVIKEGVI